MISWYLNWIDKKKVSLPLEILIFSSSLSIKTNFFSLLTFNTSESLYINVYIIQWLYNDYINISMNLFDVFLSLNYSNKQWMKILDFVVNINKIPRIFCLLDDFVYFTWRPRVVIYNYFLCNLLKSQAR